MTDSQMADERVSEMVALLVDTMVVQLVEKTAALKDAEQAVRWVALWAFAKVEMMVQRTDDEKVAMLGWKSVGEMDTGMVFDQAKSWVKKLDNFSD